MEYVPVVWGAAVSGAASAAIVQVMFKQHFLHFSFISLFNPQLQYLIQLSSVSPPLLPVCPWVHLPHNCPSQPPLLRNMSSCFSFVTEKNRRGSPVLETPSS